MIKTRYPELLLGTPAAGLWRFADSASGSFVGPYYTSKAEALADLEGYARRGGWVKDPAADQRDAILRALLALFVNCDEDACRVAAEAGCAPDDVLNLMRDRNVGSPKETPP